MEPDYFQLMLQLRDLIRELQAKWDNKDEDGMETRDSED